MRYAIFENNICCGDYYGTNLPVGAVEIPDECGIIAGQNREEFDTNWNLRPLVDRIADGLVVIPNTKKLSDDKLMIMNKSSIELILDGIESIPAGLKLNAEKTSLIPKTTLEKYQDGELSEEEVRTVLTAEIKSTRTNLLYLCDWTQLDDTNLSAELKSKWKQYRKDLRDITKQSGFPFDVSWPEQPTS